MISTNKQTTTQKKKNESDDSSGARIKLANALKEKIKRLVIKISHHQFSE